MLAASATTSAWWPSPRPERGASSSGRWRSGARPSPGCAVPGSGDRVALPGPRCWSRRRPAPTWTSWSTRWSAPPGSTRPWRRSGREAGRAGQQGNAGDGRRPRGAGGVRGRRRDRAGGLGAQRGAPVRRRTGRRARPADPHRSGGPFREWPRGAAAAGDVEEALRHPDLADGAEDHRGQRHAGEQGARGDRGALPLPAAVRRSSRWWCIRRASSTPSSSSATAACSRSWASRRMELPILYALTHPERLPDTGVRRFDPVAAGPLTFEPVRRDVFRALDAGMAAGRAGGHGAGGVQRRQRGGGRGLPRRARSPSVGSVRSSSGCSRRTRPGPPPPWRRCATPTAGRGHAPASS